MLDCLLNLFPYLVSFLYVSGVWPDRSDLQDEHEGLRLSVGFRGDKVWQRAVEVMCWNPDSPDSWQLKIVWWCKSEDKWSSALFCGDLQRIFGAHTRTHRKKKTLGQLISLGFHPAVLQPAAADGFYLGRTEFKINTFFSGDFAKTICTIHSSSPIRLAYLAISLTCSIMCIVACDQI